MHDEKDAGFYNSKTSITRREALSRTLKAVAGVGAAAVAGGIGYGVYSILSPPPPVEIEWLIWAWGVELVNDNARIFNEKNSDVKVKVTVGPGDYNGYVYTRFAAGDPPAMLYASPDSAELSLQKGWAVDIEEYFPEARRYLDEMYPGVRDLFINPQTKKLYGLNYWLGPLSLAYNERHLNLAGLDSPPKTYDELAEQAVIIKNKGITEYPLTVLWSWGFYFFVYNFMNGIIEPKPGTLYLFDEDLNPIFNYEGSPLYEWIKWTLDRIFVDKTMSPGVREVDEPAVTQAMGQGINSFALSFPDYDVAGANADVMKEKGNIKFALNPGSGYANVKPASYLISKVIMEKGPRYQEAVWRLTQFTGGKTVDGKPDFEKGEFFVCNRLIRIYGVTSAYRRVMEDPQNQEALKKFGINLDGLMAQYEKLTSSLWRDPYLAPWWGDWFTGGADTLVGGIFRTKFEQFLTGARGHAKSDILKFMQELEEDWNRLRKEAGR